MCKAPLIILISIFCFLSGCSEKKLKEENRTDTRAALHSIQKKADAVNDFYFVGMIGENPGLYKFISKNKTVKQFWSSKDEKVVELSYSANRKAAFFLTANDYGKQGVFPFISQAKLYLIDLTASKTKLVKEIGSGLQVFMLWTTDNSFKVILNSFDTTVANYVNQETFIYSEFGRELVNNSKTFDITKEGYPNPPGRIGNFSSPNGKYTVWANDSIPASIYLRQKNKSEKILMGTTDQKLNQVEWTPDSKYVIFSTLDISPMNKTLYDKQPSTSKILIYFLEEKKFTKFWEGGGVKNFFIENNYIIFDDGFGKNSIIRIYNYRTLKSIDTIQINGGCGLRNIPQIPDYSA